jgi:hypothetical protein
MPLFKYTNEPEACHYSNTNTQHTHDLQRLGKDYTPYDDLRPDRRPPACIRL